MVPFEYGGPADDAAIDLAFSRARSGDRREWVGAHVPGSHADYSRGGVTFAEFVNLELVQYAIADNVRSIPCVLDGFKPSQRKVFYACCKRGMAAGGEVKVTQLAGYVAEATAYHHGEASLAATIVGMAQDFVGANNLPLLRPVGQFGTRHAGGKDAASARYLFVSLSPLARLIFRAEDDALLPRGEDEGQPVEPAWFLPIVPMVLINGGEGVGSGYVCVYVTILVSASHVPCQVRVPRARVQHPGRD